MPGSVDELLLCVMAGVTMNLVFYNAHALFDLAKNKYYGDFDALGAAAYF